MWTRISYKTNLSTISQTLQVQDVLNIHFTAGVYRCNCVVTITVFFKFWCTLPGRDVTRVHILRLQVFTKNKICNLNIAYYVNMEPERLLAKIVHPARHCVNFEASIIIISVVCFIPSKLWVLRLRGIHDTLL